MSEKRKAPSWGSTGSTKSTTNAERKSKMTVIAEKPDQAKRMAVVLSRDPLIQKVGGDMYRFEHRNGRGQLWEITIIWVKGHVSNCKHAQLDNTSWIPSGHDVLFDAEVVFEDRIDCRQLLEHLELLGSDCRLLVVATDNDPHGEKIGQDAVTFILRKLSYAARQRITIRRARFDDLSDDSIRQAFNELGDMNQALVAAAETEIEANFRVGCAFTEHQTKILHIASPSIKAAVGTVCFGTCHTPAMGLVHQRCENLDNWRRERREIKWSVVAVDADDRLCKTTFTLGDGSSPLYFNTEEECKLKIKELTDNCDIVSAIIESVVDTRSSENRNFPLNETEVIVFGAEKLNLKVEEVIHCLEQLYYGGAISYPRTENQRFSERIAKSILEALSNSQSPLAKYCRQILDSGMPNPKQGPHGQHAHPPIHPLMVTCPLDDDNSKRIFEFVQRSTVATFLKDAVVQSTAVTATVAGRHPMTVFGRKILHSNYQEVASFNVEPDVIVKKYKRGQEIAVKLAPMKVESRPPELYTESTLLRDIKINRLATTATQGILLRELFQKKTLKMHDDKEHVVETKIAKSLSQSYIRLGAEELLLLNIRREMLNDIDRVARGVMTKAEAVSAIVGRYRPFFDKINSMEFARQVILANGNVDGLSDDAERKIQEYLKLWKCPFDGCLGSMRLSFDTPTRGTLSIACDSGKIGHGARSCSNKIRLPTWVVGAQVLDDVCRHGDHDIPCRKITFTHRGDGIRIFGQESTVCLACLRGNEASYYCLNRPNFYPTYLVERQDGSGVRDTFCKQVPQDLCLCVKPEKMLYNKKKGTYYRGCHYKFGGGNSGCEIYRHEALRSMKP